MLWHHFAIRLGLALIFGASIIELFVTLSRRTALPLITATLIAGMTGMRAYPQHSHNASQPASSGPAWSELQHSMESMHEALFSLKSTGNNDEDFVRLMLPHHQAAIDMAKAELMHGQDPQMRRLAQEIITDQESEIELMQLWLREHDGQKSKPATSAVKEQ
jgi:uncharacterized protein (DUF305 family)